MIDYHDFTTRDMPQAERRALHVGDIWINAAKCVHCGDVIRSRNRHDYRSCKCGRIAVDGGSWYVRRAAKDMSDFENIIEYFTDRATDD